MKTLKSLIQEAKKELGINTPQYERELVRIDFQIVGVKGYPSSHTKGFYVSIVGSKGICNNITDYIAKKVGGQSHLTDKYGRNSSVVFSSIAAAEEYEEMQGVIKRNRETAESESQQKLKNEEEEYRTKYSKDMKVSLEEIIKKIDGANRNRTGEIPGATDLVMEDSNNNGYKRYSFRYQGIDIKWEKEEGWNYYREYYLNNKIYWKGLDEYIYKVEFREEDSLGHVIKYIESKFW